MRFSLSILMISMLAACAHEAENTGARHSYVDLGAPASYAAQTRPADAINRDFAIAAPGRVSRFQRQTIIPGGPDGAMSPCAQSFDATMDELEGMMAPQIEANNRFAAVGDVGFTAQR